MKYELQTLPVQRAFEEGPECALCSLEEEAEERNTSFFLGNAIMAPEMRVEINRHGFCPRHFHMLLAGQGKLGYSLALGTHLEELSERFGKLQLGLTEASGKRRSAEKAAATYAEALREQEADCLMCSRIRKNLLNWAYTIVKLHGDDEEFRALFERSNGICLHHLPLVVEMGPEVLKGDALRAWHEALGRVQEHHLAQLREQLEQFSWQFDYQTEKTTPPEAKDVVPRAVKKLAGFGPSGLP